MAAAYYPGFEPDPAASIWRYMSAARYESLLTAGLYFAAAQQFDDPFEGAIGMPATRRCLADVVSRFPGEPEMHDSASEIASLRGSSPSCNGQLLAPEWQREHRHVGAIRSR